MLKWRGPRPAALPVAGSGERPSATHQGTTDPTTELGAASENAFRNGHEEEAAAAYGSAIARIAKPIGLV